MRWDAARPALDSFFTFVSFIGLSVRTGTPCTFASHFRHVAPPALHFPPTTALHSIHFISSCTECVFSLPSRKRAVLYLLADAKTRLRLKYYERKILLHDWKVVLSKLKQDFVCSNRKSIQIVPHECSLDRKNYTIFDVWTSRSKEKQFFSF